MAKTDSFDSKIKTLADLIDGHSVDDTNRVQVCIKGTINGFPATYEAIGAGFPFGGNYFIETKVIDDPNAPESSEKMRMTILPRVARGFLQFFARLLLVEAKGQDVGNKRLQREFIFSYNNGEEAQRFCQYPGVYERLMELHKYAKFSELLVKADSGLWLQQPESFKGLHADVFKETFESLGELGQIIFDSF